ncbi:hypothetical protein ACUOCP_40495, partial [Escherichia sp. R-CC3]
RCFFHPFRDFYAATGLCRDASNGTPVFNIVTFTSPLPTHRYLNNIFIIEMIVGGSEEDYHRKAG